MTQILHVFLEASQLTGTKAQAIKNLLEGFPAAGQHLIYENVNDMSWDGCPWTEDRGWSRPRLVDHDLVAEVQGGESRFRGRVKGRV